MQTETSPDKPPLAEGAASHRFFQWMRALDVPRGVGWIGGVCSGVATRLGIDPLIVRGVVVVVAVLGGPALLAYAVAWLLLPDQKSAIHLEELVKGRFSGAHAGIIAVVALSLLPIAQGVWSLGAHYWGTPSWGESVGRALWTLALIAVAVIAIVWVARRSARRAETSDAAPVPESAPSAEVAVIEREPDPTTVIADIVETAPAGAAPTIEAPPIEPAPGSSDAEFADWRERQDEWRRKNEEYRASRASSVDARREESARRAAESRLAQAAYAAQQAEKRRIRRLANPQLSAAWVFIVLGLATVLGGTAALIASGTPEWTGSVVTAGLAVAALVVGIGIICAGAARRRSGFLSFVGLVLVLVTVTAAVNDGRSWPTPEGYIADGGRYAIPAGNGQIYIGPDVGGSIDLWQGVGNLEITVEEGSAVTIHAVGTQYGWHNTVSGESDRIDSVLAGDERRLDATFGDPTATPTVLRLWQGVGAITVFDFYSTEDNE